MLQASSLRGMDSPTPVWVRRPPLLHRTWAQALTGAVGTAHDPSTQPADEDDARDPTVLYGVLVNMKSLQKFLNSHVVSTTTIACESACVSCGRECCVLIVARALVGICQNHCIILYVYIGEVAEAGGVLTFYIPAIIE